MKRRYRRHYDDYAIGENEKLYSDMAARGWFLEKRGAWFSRFRRGEPAAMRYRVEPKNGTLVAQVWEGPFGYALSEVEETTSFPLSDPGLEELRAWVGRWSAAINARPPRSLAENLERRAALQAQKAQNSDENT